MAHLLLNLVLNKHKADCHFKLKKHISLIANKKLEIISIISHHNFTISLIKKPALEKIKKQMFEQFRDKFPIENEKWADYTSCFNRIEIPAKTILLEEGDISKKLFLIEKGCVRVWFNNTGKDITVQFFFENETVASIESFRKKRPSSVTIETIEPCVLWYIQKKDIDRIITEICEIPVLRDKFTDTIFERTFVYMKQYLSFTKDTSQQRYLNLIQEKPLIVQRVPQHYIASYLGISTVHLSRIKRLLTKKKLT